MSSLESTSSYQRLLATGADMGHLQPLLCLLSALAAALLSGHRSLAPSWTNNTRSEHDNWGGRDASAAVSISITAPWPGAETLWR